ncbi:DUF434 domain-containing protein [Aquisphaera insulae]|uniref:DUF434 domain-containing protein n=1 Tax=Aquisphaera insulae TaxID=2712864 RepID=UPI0013ECD09E|nr:DUF434 domain-containing protein [Aquisphaera insulae]
MPDTRKHRGAGPRDHEWFGPEARPYLIAATSDLSWLLTRGYAEPSSLKLVGDRYRLVERQRVAVLRSACSDQSLARRHANRIVAPRGPLRIDGFNLILTLESALGGGIVLGGRDGCFRDLASVHGTYRRVEETQAALDLAGRFLTEWGIGACTWYLDAPVSNSGRLAAMIRAMGWEAAIVPDPDSILSQPGAPITTADSGILDRCGPWLNLARLLVDQVPGAFVVDLGSLQPYHQGGPAPGGGEG